MRREIKLIILVFVLVVGPAIALSFLAVRVLGNWQIVRQKSMEGAATHVLDQAVGAWGRQLESIRERAGSLSLPIRPGAGTGELVSQAAALSMDYSWLVGVFVFQSGTGLVYPPGTSAPPLFKPLNSVATPDGDLLTANPDLIILQSQRFLGESNMTPAVAAGLLRLGGVYLSKEETNAAVACFERVANFRIQNPESRIQKSAFFAKSTAAMELGGQKIEARDPEEGFYYDLIALKKLAGVVEGLGLKAREAECREESLRRVLARYDDLVPLQRDSMVEWLEGEEKTVEQKPAKIAKEENCISAGGGEENTPLSVEMAQWRERLRGRELGGDERADLAGGMGMLAPSLPDTGWMKTRLNKMDLLVTRIPGAGSASVVLVLQLNESRLGGYLNALFDSVTSNTGIRVACQTGQEINPAFLLASRQLPAPFNSIAIAATPTDAQTFLANARMQSRLYRWGGFLLLISVAAGGWLVWREAASEIRQAKERSDFAATVSHDLRTPLASMRMLAESLFMGNVTEEVKQKKFLGTIIKESDRLSRLTDRALYFIRYGQGALRYQFTEGDLGELVRGTVETFAVGVGAEVRNQISDFRFQISDSGPRIVIGLELSPELPHVMFDAGAMEQVVFNLLDNAVKYSEKDRPITIEVGVVRDVRRIVFFVKDHGVGMSPAEVDQVLKPYARGQNAKHHNARGIGLGLALCHHVVRAHGGRIQIQSEPGQGTKFSVFLPEC
ncbi:MAG: ATP-binding protein [bacterium]